MRRSYPKPTVLSKSDSKALAELPAAEGRLLPPTVELIESAEAAVDDLISWVGRATVLRAKLFVSRIACTTGPSWTHGGS